MLIEDPTEEQIKLVIDRISPNSTFKEVTDHNLQYAYILGITSDFFKDLKILPGCKLLEDLDSNFKRSEISECVSRTKEEMLDFCDMAEDTFKFLSMTNYVINVLKYSYTEEILSFIAYMMGTMTGKITTK